VGSEYASTSPNTNGTTLILLAENTPLTKLFIPTLSKEE
jgi:hypothetical protein